MQVTACHGFVNPWSRRSHGIPVEENAWIGRQGSQKRNRPQPLYAPLPPPFRTSIHPLRQLLLTPSLPPQLAALQSSHGTGRCIAVPPVTQPGLRVAIAEARLMDHQRPSSPITGEREFCPYALLQVEQIDALISFYTCFPFPDSYVKWALRQLRSRTTPE